MKYELLVKRSTMTQFESTLRSLGKLRDKIHGNIFSFPYGNLQRLYLVVSLLMLYLNFLASEALIHVPSYSPLHAEPPIIRTKINIHLCRPEMNGEPRLMGLLHQNLTHTAQIGTQTRRCRVNNPQLS